MIKRKDEQNKGYLEGICNDGVISWKTYGVGGMLEEIWWEGIMMLEIHGLNVYDFFWLADPISFLVESLS